MKAAIRQIWLLLSLLTAHINGAFSMGAVLYDNGGPLMDNILLDSSSANATSHRVSYTNRHNYSSSQHHNYRSGYNPVSNPMHSTVVISANSDLQQLDAVQWSDQQGTQSTAENSIAGQNDGTVSSTNSNRTPDFSIEVTSNVRVDLFCLIDPTFCGKVAEALSDAAMYFAQVVNIKSDIIIQASYYSFCDNNCANDTYGWGAPSSQFTLPFEDGADLNYIYPQALAKQLAPYNNTSAWANHDIVIEINHDAYMNTVNYDQAISNGWNGTGVPPGGTYYFKNDTSIGSNQIDLRYIILHEMLHGLGFISSWAAYFANEASPFRTLIDGIIDPEELQLVTPSPYWYINQQTGPIFITGFQPTMIFDKFLQSSDLQSNGTLNTSLASVGFDMQNFCVQDDQAFVINFIEEFNQANQSRLAHQLWTAMSQQGTLSFRFPAATVDNSSYNTNSYLNETYKSMLLHTDSNALTSSTELSDRNFRLGISISHIDDSYSSSPDFLMTSTFIQGESLDDIVDEVYSNIPTLYYNTTTVNNTVVQRTYRSPIGPGILRILDSMGYSTVLSNTNYTTRKAVKSGKKPSVCDYKNNNRGMSQDSKTSSSTSSSSDASILGITGFVPIIIIITISLVFVPLTTI